MNKIQLFLVFLILILLSVKLQAQTEQRVLEYEEDQQLLMTAFEHPDIPDGYDGVLVYDTAYGITLLDLSTKQQIRYSNAPTMFISSLNIQSGKILFGHAKYIFAINVTSGILESIRLDSVGAFSTFSPDGHYVLYEDFFQVGIIHVIDLERSEVFELDITEDIQPGTLYNSVWSPDGRWIVLVGVSVESSSSRAYLIDTTCISDRQCSAQMIIDNLKIPNYFAWHPDSQTLGYTTRNTHLGDKDINDDARLQFYTTPIGGNEHETLIAGNFDVVFASWNPSGEYIAFSATNVSNNTEAQADSIYVMPANGGEYEHIISERRLWPVQWYDTSFVDLGIDFEAFREQS